MQSPFCLTAVLLLSCTSIFGQIRINEIDSDTIGVDNNEFVELFDSPAIGPGAFPGSSAGSLEGVALVFFEGSDPADAAYLVVDLSGNSFGPNGFFVIGDLGVQNADLSFGPGSEQIRNGVNAVALYSGQTAADYLSGALVTPTTGPDLIDFVIHKTANLPDDSSLATVFGPSEQPSESTGGSAVSQSIQRNPDGASAFTADNPTPGTSNVQLPRILARPSPVQFLESAGLGASTVSLTREGDISVPLTILIRPTSTSNRVNFPTSLVFASGQSTASFQINVTESNSGNGDAIIQLQLEDTANPPVYQDGEVTVLLEDDDILFPSLVINELLRSGDGPRGAEYVELFNNSSTPVNLNGFELQFYGSPEGELGPLQETIPLDGMILAGNDFLLVGNELVTSRYGVTPEIEIEGLDLPDEETTVILFDSVGRPIFSALLQRNGSAALSNDGTRPLVVETRIASQDAIPAVGYFLQDDGRNEPVLLERVDPGASAPSASPGRSNEPIPSLFLTRDRFLAGEDDLEDITFVVSRIPADETVGDVLVTLLSSNSLDLEVPNSVIIPDGQSSVTFRGDLGSDAVRDGIRTVTVTATAAELAEASVDVAVLDSDVPPLMPGDLAFVTAITDEPQGFAFVTLVDIFEATRLELTDNGWQAAGGFRPGEGSLSWVATQNYAAGTVVSFTTNRPSLGAAFGEGLDLAADGDQILAYQGLAEAPSFVAGIQLQGPWNVDATSEATSALPSALGTLGAVALEPGGSNVAYQGISTGTIEELQSALFDGANFITSGSFGGVNNASAPDLFTLITDGFVYAVSTPEISVVAGGVRLSFIANAPSDIYVTSDLVNYNLVSGGSAVPSGVFLDSNPPLGSGFYLIQEAGAPAP